MSIWQLGIVVAPTTADVLASLLEARGATVEETDGGAEAAHDGLTTFLVASFEEEPDLLIIDALGSWLENLDARDARVVTRLGDDPRWSDGWEAVFHPFQLSERVWVTPVWESPRPDVRAVVIDPSTAFGSGGHPTTRGVMRMLDRRLAEQPGASVLDVGCGTGVLAIGAAVLGSPAVGVEIDEAAARDAVDNVRLNNVSDLVQIHAGTVEMASGRFDIVVANIFASVLIQIAEPVLARTKSDIILSGLLSGQLDSVLKAYAAARLVDHVEDQGWEILHLRV